MNKLNAAMKFLKNLGYKIMKENAPVMKDSLAFIYSKWLFNHFDYTFADKYGPDVAYEKALKELAAECGYEAIMKVPKDYDEFYEKWSFSIDEKPTSAKWYDEY